MSTAEKKGLGKIPRGLLGDVRLRALQRGRETIPPLAGTTKGSEVYSRLLIPGWIFAKWKFGDRTRDAFKVLH